MDNSTKLLVGLGVAAAAAGVIIYVKKKNAAALAAVGVPANATPAQAAAVAAAAASQGLATTPASQAAVFVCPQCSPSELLIAKAPSTAKMEQVISNIKSQPSWLAAIKSKADSYGRTLEQQLKLDAAWVIANP